MKETNFNHWYAEFNQLRSDYEKWEWIRDHQSLGLTVLLDNDDTYAIFDEDEDAVYILQIDNYIGNSDGIEFLLDSIGIKYNHV